MLVAGEVGEARGVEEIDAALEPQASAAEFPHLVIASVTPFGVPSPAHGWAADDLTLPLTVRNAFGAVVKLLKG